MSNLTSEPSSQEKLANQLLKAISSDNDAEMVALLDKGANLKDTPLSPDMPMMHNAAVVGAVKCIRQLASRAADPLEAVNQTTPMGITPLHQAAIGFSTDAVITLIELGADVNAKHSQLTSSPLGFALGHQMVSQAAERERVCLALIAHGAENYWGMSAVEAAAKGGFTKKLGELLQDSNHDRGALIELATKAGHIDAANLIRAQSAIEVANRHESALLKANRPS